MRLVSERPIVETVKWQRASEGEARPNVFIEAGMAMALRPRQTVLVHSGQSYVGSDFDGLNLIDLAGGPQEWLKLKARLQDAGCMLEETEDYRRGDWIATTDGLREPS